MVGEVRKMELVQMDLWFDGEAPLAGHLGGVRRTGKG
jgi:hypothetical protein